MYYTGKNPLSKIGYKSEDVVVPKGINSVVCTKRCCATTIRANWPLIRRGAGRDGEKASDWLASRLSGAGTNAG